MLRSCCMNPRLTRGEYWLLEVSVTSGTPISWFDAKAYSSCDDESWFNSIEAMFNKTGHKMSRGCLVETLTRMFENGWLKATRNEQEIAMDREQVIRALRERTNVLEERTCCRLTELGGQVWEAFAAPAWEEFIQEEIFGDENDEENYHGTITSMTRSIAEHYLANLLLMGYEVDEKSIRWEEIGEWEATYWKKLPLGYRAHFRCVQVSEDIAENQAEFGALCDFRDGWYRWQ